MLQWKWLIEQAPYILIKKMTKKTIGTIAIAIVITLAIVYLPSLMNDWNQQRIDDRGIKHCKSVGWENVEIFDYWGLSREYKESKVKWFSNLSGNNYQLIAGDYVLDNTGTEESQELLCNFLNWELHNEFPREIVEQLL